VNGAFLFSVCFGVVGKSVFGELGFCEGDGEWPVYECHIEKIFE
jgi:hypothetical protein